MSFLTYISRDPIRLAACKNCGEAFHMHDGDERCPSTREPTTKRRKIPNELLQDDWDPMWERMFYSMDIVNRAFNKACDASMQKLCATPHPLAGSGSEPDMTTATESSETSKVTPPTRTSGSTVSAAEKYLMASIFITGVSTTVALILAALLYFLAANTVVIISSSGERTSPPAAHEGTNSRPRMLF